MLYIRGRLVPGSLVYVDGAPAYAGAQFKVQIEAGAIIHVTCANQVAFNVADEILIISKNGLSRRTDKWECYANNVFSVNGHAINGCVQLCADTSILYIGPVRYVNNYLVFLEWSDAPSIKVPVDALHDKVLDFKALGIAAVPLACTNVLQLAGEVPTEADTAAEAPADTEPEQLEFVW